MEKLTLEFIENVNSKDNYEGFVKAFEKDFVNFMATNILATKEAILYTVGNCKHLYDKVFLSKIPEEVKKVYMCNTCRQFVNNYGCLVSIDKEGKLHSAVFSGTDYPIYFKDAIAACREYVESQPVQSVFLITSGPVLGHPVLGGFDHLSVTVPQEYLDRCQAICEKSTGSSRDLAGATGLLNEAHGTLARALAGYDLDKASLAVELISSEKFFSTKEQIAQAKWFRDVHALLKDAKGEERKNLLKLISSTAPVGFVGIRSGMVGVVLDQLADNKDIESITKSFNEKMDPQRYQRAQKVARDSNIKKCQEIAENLELESAFERRLAKLDELPTSIWKREETETPVQETGKKKSIFDDLYGSNEKDKKTTTSEHYSGASLNSGAITVRDFLKDVVPKMESLEINVNMSIASSTAAITTALDPEAGCLYKYDKPERRNPFAHYIISYSNAFYANSAIKDWNLHAGWNKVNAICYDPSLWFKETEELEADPNKAIIFITEGCKDEAVKEGDRGLALFSHQIRNEFHQVRATIELLSNNGSMEGYDEATACGPRFQASISRQFEVKVKLKGESLSKIYTIDRW